MTSGFQSISLTLSTYIYMWNSIYLSCPVFSVSVFEPCVRHNRWRGLQVVPWRPRVHLLRWPSVLTPEKGKPTKHMMTSSNGNIFRVTILALCAGNSPVTGEFPSQRPVTQSFDVLLGLRLYKRLGKQWSYRRFQTSSRSLWRHCNEGCETLSRWPRTSSVVEESFWNCVQRKTSHTVGRDLRYFSSIRFRAHYPYCYDLFGRVFW